MKKFAVVAMVALLVAPARAQPQTRAPRRDRRPRQARVPEGVRAVRDVEYARAGGKALLLDLYVPEEAPEKALPLVVWIHGGGWRAGSKNRCPAISFAADGYVVASVDYRLSHEATFPAQIFDCKAAIRWLRAHAAEYHVDPNHIGVWGGSAGGHLVALLGTSGDVEALEGDLGHPEQSSRVQAVCDWFGPTDFLTMRQQALERRRRQDAARPSAELQLIGGTIDERRGLAVLASPVTYVSEDDPPFLIAHGDSDPVVPVQQSQLFHDALKKAGVDSELLVLEGQGHGFRSREPFQAAVAFFERTLKGSKPHPARSRAQ